jgi:para-nitrobenzyl esterase
LSREDGARVADAFIKNLGLSKSRIADIQGLPWTRLLAAQTEIGAHGFAPVLDGVTLVRDPFDPLAPAESADVPLIVSTTLDDAGLFFFDFGRDEAELRLALRTRYGGKADEMLALYREAWPTKSPYLLHAQMMTDSGFRHFANAQAERKAQQGRAAVYTYLWEWASPAFDGKFGAAHAMDVCASFYNDRDAVLGGGSRDARIMCECLSSAWVSFAKTGDPNNAHLPHWPAFDPERRSTMILGADTRIVNDPYQAIRIFWLDMPGPRSVLG